MKITEIIKHNTFPENYLSPEEEIEYVKRKYHLDKAQTISNVRSNVVLKKVDTDFGTTMFLLVKDDEPLSVLDTTEVDIADKKYTFIKLIYVLKAYRNTNALKWLLYAVAEVLQNPVVIDGAVYSGGQRVIDFLSKNAAVKLYVLDKNTGEVSDFTEIPNSPDKVVIVTTGKHGFGTQYLDEGFMPYTWHPLEEYLGNI